MVIITTYEIWLIIIWCWSVQIMTNMKITQIDRGNKDRDRDHWAVIWCTKNQWLTLREELTLLTKQRFVLYCHTNWECLPHTSLPSSSEQLEYSTVSTQTTYTSSCRTTEMAETHEILTILRILWSFLEIPRKFTNQSRLLFEPRVRGWK